MINLEIHSCNLLNCPNYNPFFVNLTLVELKIVAVGTLSLDLRFSKSIVVEFDRTQNKLAEKGILK